MHRRLRVWVSKLLVLEEARLLLRALLLLSPGLLPMRCLASWRFFSLISRPISGFIFRLSFAEITMRTFLLRRSLWRRAMPITTACRGLPIADFFRVLRLLRRATHFSANRIDRLF